MANLGYLSEFYGREGTVEITQSNWYIVAAVSLAASGAGHNVPDLYRMATTGLLLEDEKIVQRRIKEAILKTSVLYGFPKALQALLPLFKVIDDDAIDHYGPRTEALQSQCQDREREERGREYFDITWTPDAAAANRATLQKYHPDLYLLALKFGYEYWFSEDAILSNVQTQMCNAAALICSKSPVQAMWHTRAIIRHGGNLDQARMAQDIALRIAYHYNCDTGDIIKVDDIDFEDTRPH
ncbi:uncharacterized protein N7496_003453 [Penicillium cataractarum]|uniref:Carboxymuconolactone decarboxylase-like domain-containing protein n=1 Tax=Penicillium cataractarum TaxID=2100454 RepID=A0A9W9VIU8_9EURO|nr:uncharacterized protein N7496_003453 [Penicillium cataractarum]KAJ5381025.1 hypothetical protein N7496_003453 [Penicillium cataractarum]